MSNNFIWYIDRTLSGATTLARVNLGEMAKKGYFPFSKAPTLLEPHHQIVLCHILDTCWEGGLLLCRDADCAFYSPIQLDFSSLDVKLKIYENQESLNHSPIPATCRITSNELTTPEWKTKKKSHTKKKPHWIKKKTYWIYNMNSWTYYLATTSIKKSL